MWAFCSARAAAHIYLLGGNQSDAVTVAAFPKARLLGLRWPPTQADARRRTPPGRCGLFDHALAHVLEMEGGFSDDPYDPGGPTNRGITLAVYATWKGVPADAALKDELKRIPDDGRARDLRRALLDAGGCAELAPALAFFHFDAAVNHGVVGAIRLLQHAVGTDVDGEIGPLTLRRHRAHAAARDAARLRRCAPRPLPRAAALLALRPRVARARRYHA